MKSENDIFEIYRQEIDRLNVYGLISFDNEQNEIRLTEKGRLFLELFPK